MLISVCGNPCDKLATRPGLRHEAAGIGSLRRK